MSAAVAVIFASSEDNRLNELTIHRTAASLPFGGRYRLVDFALSNLVNSNITRIGIVTRNNYSSLMDHIRMGRDWDLNRKNSGLAVFPPFGLNTSKELYKGKIDALQSIAAYVDKGKEEYVVLADANVVVNLDFTDVIAHHAKSGKPVTIVYSKTMPTSARRTIIKLDGDTVSDMLVTEVKEKAVKNVGMNIYIFNKAFLLSNVASVYSRGGYDLEKDMLFNLVAQGDVNAFEVTSYNVIIDDVTTYYSASMQLLNRENRDDLFNHSRNIYTKVKDSIPTIYLQDGKVSNSLIADGCVINGVVTNSILFRNVVVDEGAEIKDSIIMENGHVLKNTSVCNTITDKGVTVKEGHNLSGTRDYPIVVVKNKIV